MSDELLDTSTELRPKRRRATVSAEEREQATREEAERRKGELIAADQFVNPKKYDPEPDPTEYPPMDTLETVGIDDPDYLRFIENWATEEAVAPAAIHKMIREGQEALKRHLAEKEARMDETPVAEWSPPQEAMLDLQGRSYLPARWRVVWLRKGPETRRWSIETEMVHLEVGKVNGTTRFRGATVPKVEGGVAIFKAIVTNEAGRVIGEGHAIEYSEAFFDYIEKAETSAISRALAICGFGTEAALDFDEGEIADAPVDVRKLQDQRGEAPDPVIGDSEITGVRQGGRQTSATAAQLDALRRAAMAQQLTADDIVLAINSLLGDELGDEQKEFIDGWDPSRGESNKRTDIMAFAATLSHNQVGRIIADIESDAIAEATYPDDIGAK